MPSLLLRKKHNNEPTRSREGVKAKRFAASRCPRELIIKSFLALSPVHGELLICAIIPWFAVLAAMFGCAISSMRMPSAENQ
jgi:hypothetical protein